MKKLFSLLFLLVFWGSPVGATGVIGSFTGLVEDTDFDAIWVYENDDITVILDPLSTTAGLHTIFAGDADANGCTLTVERVSNGIDEGPIYVALNTIVVLADVQIGIYEINTNTSVPRCNVGYNFLALGDLETEVTGDAGETEETNETEEIAEGNPESDEGPPEDEEAVVEDEVVTPEVSTCTETDDGNAPYVQGTMSHSGNGTFTGLASPLTDYCLTPSIVREYHCAANEVNSSHVSTRTCANGCLEGHCVTDAEAVESNVEDPEEELGAYTSCTDTDFGAAPQVAGSVTAEYDRSLPQTYVDSCSGDTLTEYGCNAHASAVQTISYECPGGCNDGACVSSMCQDDDGGDKKFIFGRMTHDFAHMASPAFDTCITNKKLVEYSCGASLNDQDPANDNQKTYTCALGCLTVNSDVGTVGRCKKVADMAPVVAVSTVFSWIVNLFN